MIFYIEWYSLAYLRGLSEKNRGQSDLRQNYFVLCGMAYVLLNYCQLKISVQNSYELEFKKNDTAIITLMN